MENNGLAEAIETKLSALGSFMEDQTRRMTGVEGQVQKALLLNARIPGGGPHGGNAPVTLGATIITGAGYKAFAEAGHKGRIHAPVPIGLVRKALITSDGVNGLPVGVQQLPPSELPIPPAGVASLIPSRSTSAGAISFIRQLAPRPVAGVQVTQGSAKTEATFVFEDATLPAVTIACWVPVSKQALRDVGGLTNLIDSELTVAVVLAEDLEILTADGSTGHLSGIMPVAPAAAAGVAGDTKLDQVAKAIGELAGAGVTASGVVLNPADWTSATLLKASDGSYLLGSPAAQTAEILWGKKLVLTTSMPVGSFLVGDFRTCELAYQEFANIEVSTEHSDFFIKNLAAVRCEESVVLAVRRPDAFRKGTFGTGAEFAAAPSKKG